MVVSGDSPADAIRMVEIPERGQPIAGKMIEDIPQFSSIRINTSRFYQQNNASALCCWHQLLKAGNHSSIILRFAAYLCGTHTYIGDIEIGRYMDAGSNFLANLLVCGGISQIAYRIQAGNGEFTLHHFSADRGSHYGIGRTVFICKVGRMDIVKLDTRKSQFVGNVAKILEGIAVPAFGGKR